MPFCLPNHSFDKKSIKYDSYHELAYLHPNHFIPNELIASKYVNIKRTLLYNQIS